MKPATIGLVAEAWHEEPSNAIHGHNDGPSHEEPFARSIISYRRVRAALVSAHIEMPVTLRALMAVASGRDHPWDGSSRVNALNWVCRQALLGWCAP